MSSETCEGMWINEIQYLALSKHMPHLNTKSLSKEYHEWITFYSWYVRITQSNTFNNCIFFLLSLHYHLVTSLS